MDNRDVERCFRGEFYSHDMTVCIVVKSCVALCIQVLISQKHRNMIALSE